MKRIAGLALCLLLITGLVGCSKAPVQYKLTYVTQGQGTVAPVSGGTYAVGTVVVLEPTASTGWAFSFWGGPDGSTVVSSAGKHSIIMDKEKTVAAVFVKLEYEVSTASSPTSGGNISVTIVPKPYTATGVGVEHGKTIQLIAQPNPGYVFDHWGGDLSGAENPKTMVITAHSSITAVFAPAVSGVVIGATSLNGLSGVRMQYSGAINGEVLTDNNGHYTIKGVTGPITVTPDVSATAFGLSSFPASRQVPAPGADNNFTASMYMFATKWGSGGNANGQFNLPYNIAVDAYNNIYVADTGNHRIQKFNSSGAFLAKWGSQGTAAGQFINPTGVAIDAVGNIYVADSGNHRIQKFSSTGTFLAMWGSQGSNDGQFKYPGAVAVDAEGNIYVADTDNYRIQKLNSTGAFLTKWGSQGSADGQFRYPQSLAIDTSGYVYVSDVLNNRVQKFSSSGAFLAKFDGQGSAGAHFNTPYGLAIDAAGNIYVTDYENHRIQKFSSTGVFLTTWGSYGSADGQFYNPIGVAVDTAGNVYVMDYNNRRIQKFTIVD